MKFKNVDTAEEKTEHVILLEDIVTTDAYAEGSSMCPKKFLAVHDIVDRLTNANEAACETVFSRMLSIVGAHRPYREGNANSTFEPRCMVQMNTPELADADNHVFMKLCTDVWTAGLPAMALHPQALPIYTVNKEKQKKGNNKGKADAKESNNNGLAVTSYAALREKTDMLLRKYIEFIKSDDCEVDIEGDTWKALKYPLPEEEPPQEAPAGEQYFDPAFEFVAKGSFRLSRSRRTVWVPGMYSGSGSNLGSRQ